MVVIAQSPDGSSQVSWVQFLTVIVRLRASCLTLEINEFRCYEAKIEESEKGVRCATEAFSTTGAVHIEDCEGWWLSGCCGSVAEHWRLKPEVSWVRLPVTAGFFTFLYLRLITSKFIYVIVRAGGCLVVIGQSPDGSSQVSWVQFLVIPAVLTSGSTTSPSSPLMECPGAAAQRKTATTACHTGSANSTNLSSPRVQ